MRSSLWKVCGPMSFRVGLVAILLAGASSAAQAQLSYHGTRAGFDSAAPFTTLIDFEAGVISNVANGTSFEGPLASTTNNGVFSPGDIPVGIYFWNSCSISDNLILAGIGYNNFGWGGTGGFPSKVLMPSGDACSLSISFIPPVNAVALDIFAENDSGYRVSVFGVGGGLMDDVDGVAGETSPGFIGVVSESPISLIRMKAPSGTNTGSFEAADNVAFGVMPLFADGFESGSTSAWSS